MDGRPEVKIFDYYSKKCLRIRNPNHLSLVSMLNFCEQTRSYLPKNSTELWENCHDMFINFCRVSSLPRHRVSGSLISQKLFILVVFWVTSLRIDRKSKYDLFWDTLEIWEKKVTRLFMKRCTLASTESNDFLMGIESNGKIYHWSLLNLRKVETKIKIEISIYFCFCRNYELLLKLVSSISPRSSIEFHWINIYQLISKMRLNFYEATSRFASLISSYEENCTRACCSTILRNLLIFFYCYGEQ